MTPEDSARVAKAAVGMLSLVSVGAGLLYPVEVALSCLGGGLLALGNFLLLVWLFRQIIAAGSQAGWLVLPLVGKTGALMAAFAVAAMVFRADVLALAVGFSTVVFTVAAVGSAQYLRRAREDRV